MHTPGPWHIEEVFVHDTLTGAGGLATMITTDHGRNVARTDHDNGPLIAAAPELLDALGAALECLEETHYKCDLANPDEWACQVEAGGEHALIRDAQAALEKARVEAVPS